MASRRLTTASSARPQASSRRLRKTHARAASTARLGELPRIARDLVQAPERGARFGSPPLEDEDVDESSKRFNRTRVAPRSSSKDLLRLGELQPLDRNLPDQGLDASPVRVPPPHPP